jgi:predicted  nucleic acid-binding Zn-ribbon protein
MINYGCTSYKTCQECGEVTSSSCECLRYSCPKCGAEKMLDPRTNTISSKPLDLKQYGFNEPVDFTEIYVNVIYGWATKRGLEISKEEIRKDLVNE